MSSRRYKCLSVAQKKDIIYAVSNGEKQKNVAERFGISCSTLTSILKKKDILLAAPSCSKWKRRKPSEYPKLEECLLKWFSQCRQTNVPISGPILKEKAKMFAAKLGINDFRASEGWLEKFKKRHAINFKKICGESAAVPEDVCIEWKEKLLELIENYESRDVFNADETGLFFKCLPDRTLSFMNEKCHGGKNSKERVTLLFGTNMDGSEKLRPLMVGKSAKPRCFKNLKSFPMIYRANKKAWITTELFSEWLRMVDSDMSKQNRKILMFVDNCSAHTRVPHLANVRVEFLPPNTTSKLQPLDQGIIQNFKVLYRREIVLRMIESIDQVQEHKISLLEAMTVADKAWKMITPSTIQNCFRVCGFEKHGHEAQPYPTEEASVTDAQWDLLVTHNEDNRVTFKDFVAVDEDVAVVETYSDEAILEEDVEGLEEDFEDDEEEAVHPVSFKQAKTGLMDLRLYLAMGEVGDDVFQALHTLELSLDRIRDGHLTQKKITDFFKKK